MKTIILLDDDAELREYFSAHLQAHGFTVIAQANSQNITDLVKRNNAACIITDLIMPGHEGMEGIFLAKQIQGLKIIAMSSSSAFLRIADGLVDRCLHKPISGPDLVAVVSAVLSENDTATK
ncbi:MAG: response regulator transcription factor [Burkholderiales bacterium]|nr:response regulator transcription factor [Burkholderiales bacterium]